MLELNSTPTIKIGLEAGLPLAVEFGKKYPTVGTIVAVAHHQFLDIELSC